VLISRRGAGAGWPAAGIAALAVLSGCGTPPRPEAAAPPVRLAPPAAIATRPWHLDPARSEVRILAFRAGPLARLGHNHVILGRDLAGRLAVPVAGGYDGARFSVSLPVSGLVVDDADARSAEGADFDSRPTPADVAGTREHMLGSRLLDAAAFPAILVRGRVAAGAGGLHADAVAVVRGREAPLSAPLEATAAGGVLTVSGAFHVTHAALGLTPYSVGLGALSVREDIEVRFRLVAVPGD